MSINPAPRRAHAASLLAVVLSTAWPARYVTAQEPVAPLKQEEKNKEKFSPEIEAKLAEVLRKMTEVMRKLWAVRMKKEVEDVQKAVSSSEEAGKALQAGSAEAIDRSAEDFSVKMDTLFRRQAKMLPKEVLPMLDQALLQVDAVATQGPALAAMGAVEPVDQPAWAETLERTLTPEQLTAWKKVLADRREVIFKEAGDAIKGMRERMRERFAREIAGRVADIELELGPFPKDRADQFDALAKEAVEKALDRWQAGAEKFLVSVNEGQRRQMLARGGVYSGEPDASPEDQNVWKDGLGKLLSADDRKKLESGREERLRRRVKSMATVMVALLDEKAAFTESQRPLLEPIAERLVKDQPALFPGDNENTYNYVPSAAFFTAGSKAPDQDLASILDPAQRKRWQATCHEAPGDTEDSGDSALPRTEDAAPGLPARPPEPEDLERAISDFLAGLTAAERVRTLDATSLKAEDAARAAQLPAAAASRLQTAARGAAERSLESWKSDADQTVRSNLSDATAENVKQRLAAMQGDYNFRRNLTSGTAKEPIWDKAVKTELTEAQQAAWKKEVDARELYAEKAVTSAIMAEFCRLNSLSVEQSDKLQPLVAKVVIEYSPDIRNYFSYYNQGPWYLQYSTKFVPVAGVPEAEIKAILSKEQWERWTASNEFGNANNYWENLQRMHEQRTKVKKR